ncbi:MAG: ankyrin repeat domain-containing protein [Clostridiales bacterium]|nr:ankyrin repeat domain-containing protein [Clostridiales bacterium]
MRIRLGNIKTFIKKELIKIGLDMGVYTSHMLLYCIENDMKEEAIELIRNKIGINRPNVVGETPLHLAVLNGMYGITRKLINSGAYINAVDNNRRTSLHYAINLGDVKFVKLLIANGAQLNARDKFFRTPMHYAAIRDDREIIKLLIDNNSSINVRDLNGETPLYLAIKREKYEAIDVLFENKADLNISNKYGNTLLHIAVTKDNYKVARKLIDLKVDINLKNVVGETPLIVAVTINNFRMADLLIKNGAEMSAIEKLQRVEIVDISLRGGSRDMVALLIRNGANITRRLLRWAKARKEKEILREIDKWMALNNNDIEKLLRVINDEKNNYISYNNKKLLKIAIIKGRKEMANVLMHNLTNDKIRTLKCLLEDKELDDAFDKIKEKFYNIKVERNEYAKKIILDCIFESKLIKTKAPIMEKK